MTVVKVPCKDCDKRSVGCHSTCEKYIAFTKAREQGKKQKLSGMNLIFSDYCKDRNISYARKKKRKGF